MSLTPKEFRDLWQTPPEIFQFLDRIYSFDVDLAANVENAFCPLFITEQDDATAFPWHLLGKTGFCNPPYSNQRGFFDRAVIEAYEGFQSVLLVPCFNGASYWKPISQVAHITNIIGRLAFIAAADFEKVYEDGRVTRIKKGQRVGGNDSGSCLVQFGGERRLPEWLDREDFK